MEQWRDIPGYERLYEASNNGRIKNAKTGRVLKSRLKRSSGGWKYYEVVLWKDGKPHYLLISRIVAMTWCNGYFQNATVNHIDGNTTNNHADNLEWLSTGDNIRHAHMTGLCSKDRPTKLIDQQGVSHIFHSMISASKYLGRCDRYIFDSIKHGRKIATSLTGDKYVIYGG